MAATWSYTGGIDRRAVIALANRLIAQAPERKDQARSVLNGLFGDRLEGASELAIPLRLAVDDEAQTATRTSSARRACVYVHGLMGSRHDWSSSTDVSYPAALHHRMDAVPVYAEYNSGRHISTNGRELAAALENLFADWTSLEEVSIIAHSMGGLVVRAACHYGHMAGHAWVGRLRRVFMLGTPAHGAALEQVVHVAAFELEAIWNPWTRLIAKAINLRSAGIKDLRHGFVLDEDWRHRDQDELRLAAPRVPTLPAHVRWFVAAGTLGDDDHWLTRVFGDGMVRPASAEGRGFGSTRSVLGGAQIQRFESTSHMALLQDAAVLDQIVAWWGSPASPAKLR